MGQVIYVSAIGVEIKRSEDHPALAEMQEWVGGYIEHVAWPGLTFEGEPCELVIHEEGKLIGLAPNNLANAILSESGYGGQDYIVGPVIIFKGMSLE